MSQCCTHTVHVRNMLHFSVCTFLEEVLASSSVVWWAPDGMKIPIHVAFNDALVQDFQFSIYIYGRDLHHPGIDPVSQGEHFLYLRVECSVP